MKKMLLVSLSLLSLVILGGITTIPLSIPMLIVCAVIFRKSWVFFLAFSLGFIFDLFLIKPLGQTSLFFTVFISIIFLYERKFETRTATFVFFAVFIGSLVYLKIFDYQQILIQSIINSLLGVFVFKIIQNPNVKTQK